MAEQKKTRTSARKIKDRWKAKGWDNLLAPEMFNKQVLGETVADESGKIVGRITEVTVQDLTGDFSKMHIKLHFKVQNVQGQDALTQFIGHAMTSDYVRRLTRRKRTRTDGTFDVTTKDAWKVRVKPMAIADRRIQSSKQRGIRQQRTRKPRAARKSYYRTTSDARCRGGSAWWSVGLIGFSRAHDHGAPGTSGGPGFKSPPRHFLFLIDQRRAGRTASTIRKFGSRSMSRKYRGNRLSASAFGSC